MPWLHASDVPLVQRVVTHVLQTERDGGLPRLPWHLGLSASERRAMHEEWESPCALWEELELRERPTVAPVDDGELLNALRDLLMANRVTADARGTVLVNVLTCACFGNHHLWQDLGTTGRDEVSRLLEVGFPALFASNTRNLRWKRHLFLVLGEQLGRVDMRPPKCDACDNFEACFGSPAPTAMKAWPLTPTN